MTPLDWEEAATDEYVDSARYYEEQQDGLGDEFIDCIEAAVMKARRVSTDRARSIRSLRLGVAPSYRRAGSSSVRPCWCQRNCGSLRDRDGALRCGVSPE